MERRALIALALSFLVFMAFIYYGEKPKPAMAPSPTTQTPAAPSTAPAPAPVPLPSTAAVRPTAPGKPPSTRPAKDVVVDTPSFKAVFTELGGGSRASI
jgi:YidC/Oxa1 family membrane protein insertase